MRNKIHEGKIVEKKDKYEILDCINCGFKHIMPIPSDEEVEKIYRDDYYSKEKPDYISKYKEDLDWWSSVYEYRLNLFDSFFDKKNKKILDIGSGPGYFLNIAKNRNWEVLGMEPNKDAALYSRNLGLTIIEEFYTKKNSQSIGKFDVINLGEVLEHLQNPLDFILQLKNNLNENGVLSIIVPNDFNPFQLILNKQLGYNSWWLAPPYHINYFNFESLSSLLIEAGFSILHKESTFPIDMFLMMGDNYINDNSLGRKCHTKRMQFEKELIKWDNGELLRKLYIKFGELNIGREIFICARKN